MQFAYSVLSIAAVALAATTVTEEVSVTVTPSAEVISVYTDASGQEVSTAIATLALSDAQSQYGDLAASNIEIITTIGPSHAATTVTTTTGTHKYGRFDKTKASSDTTSTGTHKYGRFDKTKASSESTSTGTHKYGRFDKTAEGTATAVQKDATANQANKNYNGMGLGAAALVGALLAY